MPSSIILYHLVLMHLQEYSNYRARAEIERLYTDYNMDMCSRCYEISICIVL